MKLKLKNMTHKEWLAYNEKLISKQNEKFSLRKCTRTRFRDANQERKKIYRRSSARLLGRMANPLLTKFAGNFIQKAQMEIICKTSIGTKVILRKTRRNGEFKVVNQDFQNLTIEQTQQEWREVFNTYKKFFPERNPKDIEELSHTKNIKTELKEFTIQPMGAKPIRVFADSYKPFFNETLPISGQDIKPDFTKLDQCIKNQTESKTLPSAKDFHFIQPNGKPKSFKVIGSR